MMSNHLDLHLLSLRPGTWQKTGFMGKHKLHSQTSNAESFVCLKDVANKLYNDFRTDIWCQLCVIYCRTKLIISLKLMSTTDLICS